MGPTDPFSNQSSSSNTSAPRAEQPSDGRATTRLALGLGAVVGGGIGVVNIFFGLSSSITVLVWVILSMTVAWGLTRLLSGRLNIRGALEALVRKD